MFNKFMKGSKVIINGPGQNDGKKYSNQLAIILERDPYFKDYHVEFEDTTCDWIKSKYISKPYTE